MAQIQITLNHLISAIVYVFAFLLAVTIATFGVVEMLEAAVFGFADIGDIPRGHDFFVNGILRGLECFLLSPMPLLLAFAVRDLIPAYKNSSSSSLGSEEEKGKRIGSAHLKLQKLKTTMIGLMATAMATNMLEKAFGNKLDLQALIPCSTLLLLLVGYAYLLDKHYK